MSVTASTGKSQALCGLWFATLCCSGVAEPMRSLPVGSFVNRTEDNELFRESQWIA